MRAPLWSYARFDWVRLQRLCTQFVARQVGRINPFQGEAGRECSAQLGISPALDWQSQHAATFTCPVALVVVALRELQA